MLAGFSHLVYSDFKTQEFIRINVCPRAPKAVKMPLYPTAKGFCISETFPLNGALRAESELRTVSSLLFLKSLKKKKDHLNIVFSVPLLYRQCPMIIFSSLNFILNN